MNISVSYELVTHKVYSLIICFQGIATHAYCACSKTRDSDLQL